MIPSPIHPVTVHSVLTVISPPSQLVQPPSHIVSRPLRLRYRFLHPDTPTAYLCWPSPDQDRAIALLEDLSIDHHSPDPQAVRYISDGDLLLAHVAVTPDLRLVFHWDRDGEDGWRYHDAKLMPFPPGCHVALQSAIIASPVVHATNTSASEHDALDDDNDAYWNAYDQRGEDQESLDFSGPHSQEIEQADSEDAYWAKYAAVQGISAPNHLLAIPAHLTEGSADSTVPSPLPRNGQKQQLLTAPVMAEETAHQALSDSCTHLGVPSPDAIIAAINAIVSEDRSQCLSPCPIDFGRLSGSESTLPSPPSDLTGSVNGSSSSAEPSFCSCTDDVVPALAPQPSEQSTGLVCEGNGLDVHNQECDRALRDNIGAVYRLWKAGRQKCLEVDDRSTTQLDEKELFLRIVRDSINLQ